MTLFAVLVTVITLATSSQVANGQGLIWKKPGTKKFTVIYSGTYTETIPNASTEKKPEIRREVIVRFLGKDKGFHAGKEVECALFEITVSTGEVKEGAIFDAGPGARRSYKALIPVSAIEGKAQDADGIFVSMLPIATDKTGKTVYGLMKIGGGPAKRMKSPVLQVYPMLTLLQHYRTLTEVSSQGPVTVAGKQLTSGQYKRYSATRTVESSSSQSINTAKIIRTDSVPTGLGGWEVTLVRREKNAAQSRNEFKKETSLVTTITTKLTCAEIKMDAVSELPAVK